jgi:tetratricopeptide (TPR) repeat protein
MKNKSKNSEQCCDSKLKTSTLSFKFYFRIFCLSFLAWYFLASLTGAAISSEQTAPTDLPIPHSAETSQDANTLAVLSTSSGRLRHQLWQSRIGTPKCEKDERDKSELERIIEQLRSVEFEPEKLASEPVIVVEPLLTIGPNETLLIAEVPNGPAEKETTLRLPYEPVSEQTLQMVENLSQHPEQVGNPFELGEVLCLSGNMKEAAMFYQEALNRKGADEARSAQDRAWILLQIGNCLRNLDPPTAKKMYRQLIAEYPDSLWTDFAKAQDKSIDWYQKDKPWMLIENPILTKSGVSPE